jgi:hypothetical protein
MVSSKETVSLNKPRRRRSIAEAKLPINDDATVILECMK